MLIQGQVGQPSARSIAGGATPPVRQGQLGDVIVSELHGRYYETAYQRNLYSGVLTAAQTTSAALAASFVGLMLYNPPNSTVNCAVNKIGMSFLVAFAAGATVGIMTAQTTTPLATFSTANTALKNNFVGRAGVGVGQAQVYSTATIATAEPGLPGIHMVFGSGLTGAITTVPQVPGFFVDLEGGLILPPGAYMATYTSTASGASSMLASFTWEEIPI
jgi:hypothetical protein